MKPEIKNVGTFVDGKDGNIAIGGWVIQSLDNSEPYVVDELREIAKQHGTYIDQRLCGEMN